MKTSKLTEATKKPNTSNANLGNTLSTGASNRIITSIKTNINYDSIENGGQTGLNNSSLNLRGYDEKLREKVLYVSSYTSDSKFKGYISTFNEKSKTEYNTDTNNNAKKTINVNQYNSSKTKQEKNKNNSTYKLYQTYIPSKTESIQITRIITTENKDIKNISIYQPKNKTMIKTKTTKINTENNKYRDRRGDNNALLQKVQTKIETKIDTNKYKRPTVIHENRTRDNFAKVITTETQINKDRKPEDRIRQVIRKTEDGTNNNLFRNIKNKYLLKLIFNYLKKEKLLNIIRYNKEIQNRLEININDYIKCSKIEIEIILWEGEKYLPFDFINVNKEDEPYFHIYFDDSEKEIKKYSLNKENVNKIKVIIDYEVKSLRKLFYLCYKNKKITFKKFHRYDIKDMGYMFGECQGLIELNLSNFNTNNVTDMSGMFYNCPYIKELNLTNFSTNQVNNMSRMFQGCKSLKKLNLSSFNTNNVTDMYLMFAFCESLENLNLSNFDTKNVVDMSKMFIYCFWLNEINISNFIINETTNWSDMFKGCSGLLTKKIRDKIKILK